MKLFARSVVGIDISCSQIRFVELRGNASPVIQNMGSMYVSDEVVKNGKVVDSVKFKTVLESLWKKYKIKSKDIVLGVSNSDIIMRFVNLPKLPVNKLANMIRFQASDFMPVNIEDYEIDFTIVSEDTNDSGSFYKVLLVAAGKKMLYEYINAFIDLDLYIKDIKSSVLVMDRIIPEEYRNSVSVVVDITPEACNLLIVNNKFPAFARTILFSDTIAKKVNALMSYTGKTRGDTGNPHRDKRDKSYINKTNVNKTNIDKAHKDKFIDDKSDAMYLPKYPYNEKTSDFMNVYEGFDNGNIAVLKKENILEIDDEFDFEINHEFNIDSLVNDVVNYIGGEIASSISYFQSQNRDLIIDRIFLLGGGCFNTVVYDGLINLIGPNACVLRPYEYMFSTLPKKNDIEEFEPAEYAIALSLAMHGLGG